MKRRLCGALASALVIAAAAVSAADAPAAKFTLTSPDIAAGGRIADAQVFNGFGCQGGNLSPALSWSQAPKGTQSFALLVHDPDAPTGSGWWHWLVYNIPANVTSLAGGADFGSSGYGGPCPPPGKPHHYFFRLYALKVARLDLPQDATAAFISFNVHSQSLGSAEFVGLYGR
jgi:phosphatidylethanolamine-binding protein (PEBP) family uncharacterized protein